jgi:putative NADH-flavin reductase
MKPLNVVVFGASRGTGRELVAQAREQGHRVTAFARNPDPVHVADHAIHTIRGDLLDAGAAARAIEGQDVIFSTVGIAAGDGRKPTTLFSEGMKHIAAGARQAGVRRILCLGSCGTDPGTRPFLPVRLMAPLLKPLFRGIYDDITRMETWLADVDLDWTVIRPPYLTTGKFNGRYRIGIGEHLANVARISRADLADCMLQLVPNRATFRTWVEASQ